MPTPLIDFDSYAIDALPVNKRLPKFALFVQSLLSYVKWLYSYFRIYSKLGFTGTVYNPAVTYNKGDKTRDLSGVYESLVDSNVGNPTYDTTKWEKELDFFIPALDRVKFTGWYLNLTYELNRYFNTTFRQPPYPAPYGGSGSFSDIYITNDSITHGQFVMYPDWYKSTPIYPTTSSPYYMWPASAFTVVNVYKFIVHVPSAVITSLGSITIAVPIINSIVDKYVPVGIGYEISVY